MRAVGLGSRQGIPIERREGRWHISIRHWWVARREMLGLSTSRDDVLVIPLPHTARSTR